MSSRPNADHAEPISARRRPRTRPQRGVGVPALAQSSGNIFTDIFKPPGSVPQQPQQDPLASAQADMLMRMDRLENTIRQLTGQVEQLQFRVQQLESGAPRPPGAAPAATAQTPPQANRAPVSVPQSAPLAPPPGTRAHGGGQAIGRLRPGMTPGRRRPPAAVGFARILVRRPRRSGRYRPAGAPRAGGQVAALPPSNAARTCLTSARAICSARIMRRRSRPSANFVQTYPSDRLVPEATYFVGESLFQRQDYKDAAEYFLQVSTKFPNAPRAPEALLRLGQSLSGLNERGKLPAPPSARWTANIRGRVPASVRRWNASEACRLLRPTPIFRRRAWTRCSRRFVPFPIS